MNDPIICHKGIITDYRKYKDWRLVFGELLYSNIIKDYRKYKDLRLVFGELLYSNLVK